MEPRPCKAMAVHVQGFSPPEGLAKGVGEVGCSSEKVSGGYSKEKVSVEAGNPEAQGLQF